MTSLKHVFLNVQNNPKNKTCSWCDGISWWKSIFIISFLFSPFKRRIKFCSRWKRIKALDRYRLYLYRPCFYSSQNMRVRRMKKKYIWFRMKRQRWWKEWGWNEDKSEIREVLAILNCGLHNVEERWIRRGEEKENKFHSILCFSSIVLFQRRLSLSLSLWIWSVREIHSTTYAILTTFPSFDLVFFFLSVS